MSLEWSDQVQTCKGNELKVKGRGHGDPQGHNYISGHNFVSNKDGDLQQPFLEFADHVQACEGRPNCANCKGQGHGELKCPNL